MGLVRMGPPTELVIKLAKEFKIATFIETGTYYGETSYWASQYFEKVYTIEQSKELYEKAISKFSYIKNLKFIFGDSKIELGKIIKLVRSSSLFWLDAHWSGGATYGQNEECPLIQEIKVIVNQNRFDSFIFIDDARLFTSPPPFPHKMEQWPDITLIIETLNSGLSKKYIVIFEDVIIAVPNFAKQFLAGYCQEVNTKKWHESNIFEK